MAGIAEAKVRGRDRCRIAVAACVLSIPFDETGAAGTWRLLKPQAPSDNDRFNKRGFASESNAIRQRDKEGCV